MKLHFVGDISLGEYYLTFGHGVKTVCKNVDPFELCEQIFSKSDAVIGNLEGPASNVGNNPSEPESVVLRADPNSIRYLSKSNFKIVQVANNHSIQHGIECFNDSNQKLLKYNILPVGLINQRITKIIIHGESIGFLAASDVTDNTEPSQDIYQYLNHEFIDRIKNSVSEVDHLFVLLHWGLESSTKPLRYQDELAMELKELGVRGVIGSHPHLFYPITSYDNFVYAPSLGNFIFDDGWDSRKLKTGILELDLKKNFMAVKVIPIHIRKSDFRPKPFGDKIPITGEYKLYKLGDKMNYQQLKKTLFFFRHLPKGNMLLKLKFFSRKLLRIFS
ncbi:MAG: CapA family protein [Natronospirillum sp.]|uniref:CapA family protein n=1 Tax=Natronospirillum sp. TaxID=2812955 RepID=UPI0025E57834|nr:CapA family protein [Natronospirillum sp.]MCH8551564.1 CapA family protein [Natronospirillum sp.]